MKNNRQKFKLRFYARHQHGGTYQFEYAGKTVEECIIKGLCYDSRITSFTIRRGKGEGRNIKMREYIPSLFKDWDSLKSRKRVKL